MIEKSIARGSSVAFESIFSLQSFFPFWQESLGKWFNVMYLCSIKGNVWFGQLDIKCALDEHSSVTGALLLPLSFFDEQNSQEDSILKLDCRDNNTKIGIIYW